MIAQPKLIVGAPARPRSRYLAAIPAAVSEPLSIFLVTRIALFVLAFAAQVFLPFHTGSKHDYFPNNYFLDGWGRWDSAWYISIARQGYSLDPKTYYSNIAFFPLYPLLIRLVGEVVRNLPLAGILVANLTFAGALLVVYRLALLRFDRRVARWTLIFLCAFPYAFFFAAIYSESLFLLLSALSFYLAERERWWLSGLAGLLAALSRSIGGALGPAIFLIYLAHKRYRLKELDRNLFAPALAPLGSALYMAYLGIRFHDPLAFAKASLLAWGRYDVLVQGLGRFDPATWNTGNYDLVLATNFVVAVLWLLLAIPTLRLLGPGYAFYLLIAVAIPLSGQVESLGRFVAVLFPGFIVVAYYLKDSLAGKLVLISSTLLLGLFTALFANWYWIV